MEDQSKPCSPNSANTDDLYLHLEEIAKNTDSSSHEDRSVSDIFADSDRSLSDIFADSDTESATKGTQCDGDKSDKRCEKVCTPETVSDTEEMELQVESGDEPDTVTLTLLDSKGRKVGSTITGGPRVMEALKHKPLKAIPFFAHPPPVDKDGNLYLGKHHRLKSGTGSLREIRRYQRSTQTLIPIAAFKRLIQEVRSDLNLDCSFSKESYEALQEAGERYCVQIFNLANRIATHSKRVTLQLKDMKLALEILNEPWDVPGPSFTA